MPPDEDITLPPDDKLPQAPSVGLAAELTEVRDDARALIEVLMKSHHTNQGLPPDFPREPLIDIAKSLMQLRDAETEGIEVVLGYARLRLTAVRRRHVAPSERPDLPEHAAQAPSRGGVLDNKLALLIAAVSTALDQFKRGDLKDDPDERDPGIESRGDKRSATLNEKTAELQTTLDAGAAELKAEKVKDSKLADAAARSTESASAILRSARAETRMPEVVPSWLQRLSSGLTVAAGAVRRTLPLIKSGVDITQKGHNYLRDFSDRAGKTFWDFAYAEIKHAIDGFNRFLAEIEGEPSAAPPPPDFDMKKVHEMILAGQAPPRTWVPWINRLAFEKPSLIDLRHLSGLYALTDLSAAETISKDLKFLKNLTKLESLVIHGREIDDVSAISGLRLLRNLILWHSKLEDISPLSNLSDLESLALWSAPVRKIDALSGLLKLRNLILTKAEVDYIHPLTELKALSTLSISSMRLQDVSALASLRNLETLSLSGTIVREIAPLSGLVSLMALYLNGTKIDDLSAVSDLVGLQSLHLVQTSVEDISALSGLTALQTLNLARTQVSDVSALSGLTALQTLDLAGTPVRTLAPLGALEKLNEVYVSQSDRDALAKTHPRGADIVKIRG